MVNRSTSSKSRPRVGGTTYKRRKAAPPTAPTTLNR